MKRYRLESSEHHCFVEDEYTVYGEGTLKRIARTDPRFRGCAVWATIETPVPRFRRGVIYKKAGTRPRGGSGRLS